MREKRDIFNDWVFPVGSTIAVHYYIRKFRLWQPPVIRISFRGQACCMTHIFSIIKNCGKLLKQWLIRISPGNEKMTKEVEFAPIRPLDDYLTSRFGLPDYQNKERWNYRIVNNLLFYQTNYMISAFIIFLIVGWVTFTNGWVLLNWTQNWRYCCYCIVQWVFVPRYMKPLEMLLGGALVAGTFAVMIYISSNRLVFATWMRFCGP